MELDWIGIAGGEMPKLRNGKSHDFDSGNSEPITLPAVFPLELKFVSCK